VTKRRSSWPSEHPLIPNGAKNGGYSGHTRQSRMACYQGSHR